jgi:four helix bundle protein
MVKRMIEDLPRGCGFLGDQARRASASVVLNFAEGTGKRSKAERLRFFRMARASAYEVGAVFEVAERLGAVEPRLVEQAVDGCDHVAAMLSRYR